MKKLKKKIFDSIQGCEGAYVSPDQLSEEVDKLIRYAIENRDDRAVSISEMEASKLITNVINSLGYSVDIHVGRDLWELISEDSRAQWLHPPESEREVIISLVNVGQNMAKSECYIEFI